MLNDIFEEYENEFSINSDTRFCLYIDIPFCKSVCKYCVHKTSKYDENIVQSYKKAILKELSLSKDFLLKHNIYSLYFGGGTPSLWTTDELKEIRNLIPNYGNIQIKKFEVHPYDLNNQYINELKNILDLTEVSIGVQSFDRKSCSNNFRLWCNKDKIKEYVDELQKNNVLVNLDLVCLFGGDENEYWDIFKKDLNIATNYIKPDCIMTVINYKTKLNYNSLISRFNKIVIDCCKNTNMIYRPLDPLSFLDSFTGDVQNDKWIVTKEYMKFISNKPRYSESGPDQCYNLQQTTLGLGGFRSHLSYGILPKSNKAIYSRYNSDEDCFNKLIMNIKDCPPKEEYIKNYKLIKSW